MPETGLPLERFDPGSALEDFAGEARALCEKSAVVYLQNHCGTGQVLAEPHWIGVVLHNLLSFALGTAKSGAIIRLDSNIDSVSWRAELEQQGLLGGAERQQLVVDQLFRLPRINQQTGDHTSLALCKSIITLHRGRIWAEPCRGSDGLRLLFEIPAVP
jgi:two-component system heavy metal sensor histidine kinase CusS